MVSVSRKRVLVIDDEPLVLRSVSMVLTSAGYEVESAASGAEALNRMKGEHFDLVVTDWKMPYMHGDRVAGEIRKRSPLTPVLLLTGSIMEAPPSGFDAVLFKPFSIHELREAVDHLAKPPSA